MSASILNARHLSKVVPSTEGELAILHDLSLDLAKGDSLAIGESYGFKRMTELMGFPEVWDFETRWAQPPAKAAE